jgi:ribosomal protein L11 methyltransferase
MPDEWIDVCIEANLDAGDVLSRLNDPTLQGAWEDAGVVHLYWAEDRWNSDRLAAVRAALSGLKSGDIPLSIHRVPKQDWNAAWARSVRPLRIGRLMIRPSWEPVALGPGDVEIILDPKQAFGTGHHATTRMLLEWLQDLIVGGETVLDVGFGSGILAMAALKLGAASAIGVECDPVAVACAREYADDNRFGPELDLICGTLETLGHRPCVHLVLANLDRQTLLGSVEELTAYGQAGARMLFSGLLVEQEEEVLALYASRGLYRTARREQDGWVALALQAGEGCEGMGR